MPVPIRLILVSLHLHFTILGFPRAKDMQRKNTRKFWWRRVLMNSSCKARCRGLRMPPPRFMSPGCSPSQNGGLSVVVRLKLLRHQLRCLRQYRTQALLGITSGRTATSSSHLLSPGIWFEDQYSSQQTSQQTDPAPDPDLCSPKDWLDGRRVAPPGRDGVMLLRHALVADLASGALAQWHVC